MATLSLRISDQEHIQIQEKAKQAGISVSEFLRMAALTTEIQSVLPKQKIAKTLCEYHNRIDDANTLAEARQITHELEAILYGCL